MDKFIKLNSIFFRVSEIVGYYHHKTDAGVLSVDVYLSFPVNGSHCLAVKMTQGEFDNFIKVVRE